MRLLSYCNCGSDNCEWKSCLIVTNENIFSLFFSFRFIAIPTGPKIEAAINFVQNSNKPDAWAAIGDLKDAAKILSNEEGTLVKKKVEGNVIWRERGEEESASSKPPKLTQDPPKYG